MSESEAAVEQVAETEQDVTGGDNPPVVAEVSEPAQVKISVQNPTKEEMVVILAGIKENYNLDVDVKAVEFRFKKTKDKETGIETVRDTVELPIPYPSLQGIVHILEHGADTPEEDAEAGVATGVGKLQFELLQEAMADVINSQARELLYEDTSFNASNFPTDKLSWEFIAKLPKAQRRGGGIAKETWEAFVADYVAVMPEATGKTMEQCGNAAKILMNKLAQVKTNDAVLNLMVEMLGIYANATESLEEYAECVEFLLKKADTFLNLTEEDLLANL